MTPTTLPKYEPRRVCPTFTSPRSCLHFSLYNLDRLYNSSSPTLFSSLCKYLTAVALLIVTKSTINEPISEIFSMGTQMAAGCLDDGEFWLPPRFLSDDDLLVGRTPKNKDGFGFMADATPHKRGLFSFDSPYGGIGSFGGYSDLSSPSTKTQSDEEDFLTGLTNQLGRSNISDGFGRSQPSFASENPKVRSRCMNQQRCNGPSSPPSWDLLYAAAQEVARMRLIEDRLSFNKSTMAPPRKPSPNSVAAKTPYPDAGFYPHPRLGAAKIQRSGVLGAAQGKGAGDFKPQPVVQNREFIGFGGSARPGLSPCAWSPEQIQANRSEMRAMFFGEKKECAGTGVFLPRRNAGASETRKMPGCSVLLPARVVQALNLNLDKMGPESQLLPSFNGSSTAENGVPLRLGGGRVEHTERRGHNNLRPQPGMKHEIRLPQEWTY